MDGFQAGGATSARKTILVVDDTPENVMVLGEILAENFTVTIANSGHGALLGAHASPRPDLILLDVMMPDMSGYDVLKRLRGDPATREIPVMFVSALDGSEDETHGILLGAADYITKPVRPAVVLARVYAQLELKQARDKARDQNAWLEAEIERRMKQNQKIQDVAMRALASLAETRDNETGNHILRTQGYVGVLSRGLSKLPQYRDLLTPSVIESYIKAAPLHDLGKVGIPDHILHKPGPLTPEEWQIMRTHAALGAEAIWRAIKDEEDRDGLDFLKIAMEIAGAHHEKWDGSGYPAGLAGDAIPLAGRIMALADVFDALINRRVYKPAFSIAAATEMIREGRGTHFDPDVVDAFLASVDDFQKIAQQFSDEVDA